VKLPGGIHLLLRQEIISTPWAQFGRDIIKDKSLEENFHFSKILHPFSSAIAADYEEGLATPFPLDLR